MNQRLVLVEKEREKTEGGEVGGGGKRVKGEGRGKDGGRRGGVREEER